MRIMHWCPSFFPNPNFGGTAVFVDHLCNEQVRNGHELMVVTEAYQGCKPIEVYQGITIMRFPFTSIAISGSVNDIKKLTNDVSELKKTYQPDAIHIHPNGLSAWFELLSKNAYKANRIVTIHTPIDDSKFAKNFLKRIMLESDFLVTISKSQNQEIQHFLNGHNKNTYLIYNGIENVLIPVTPIIFNPTTILLIGRLHQTKGFHIALEAFAKFKKSTKHSVTMIIAGDGPELLNLKQLGDDLGITKHELTFTGWVETKNIPALINDSSFIIMPSIWNEPFGLVAVQAALMGRPIIASNVGGIPEIVKDRETGILVPPENIGAIQDAIELLISDSPLAMKLGENALKFAEIEFSIKRCAYEYELLYNK